MRKVLGYVLLFVLSGIPFGVGKLGGPTRYENVTGFLLWLALTPLFFIGATMIGRWTGLGGLRDLGLRRHQGWGRNLGLGVLLGLAQILLMLAVLLAGGVLAIDGVKPLIRVAPFVLATAANFAFVALSEEVTERGFLLRALPQGWGPVLRVGAGAVIFMLSHVPMQGTYWPNMVNWLISGVAFAVPYLVTGSLWFSVGAHWAGDAFWQLLAMEPGVLLLHGTGSWGWLMLVPSGVNLLALLALPLVLRLTVRVEVRETTTLEEASA